MDDNERDATGREPVAHPTSEPPTGEPPVRFQGDEADLYLAYNHVMVKNLYAHTWGVRHEDVEDAAAFAWVQFFRYQPDRDRQWEGWLYRTAQRELWKLNATRNSELSIVASPKELGIRSAKEVADPRDRLNERVDFLAAMDEVKRLPKRVRQAVVVRSQVSRQSDVAEIPGLHASRVSYLLASVAPTLHEMAEKRAVRDRPVASPRAARLRELEEPDWILESIGRLPIRGKNASASVLAWRRAALAIDDYRHDHGWNSEIDGMGPEPTADLPARRAYERAERAIAQSHEARLRQSGKWHER